MRPRPWLAQHQPEGRGSVSLIAPTHLAVDTCRMAKKPEPPPKPIRWGIYKIASKAVWLGNVEATDEAAAIEKGAAEFKVTATRLLAVRR
jgi:hypothetical protein